MGRFDETHMDVKVPSAPLVVGLTSDTTESGYFPFLVMKGVLAWKGNESVVEHEVPLVLPPACLGESCTAEGIWAAVMSKLPLTWRAI